MENDIRYIPLGKDRFAVVDAEDYELVSRFTWHYEAIHGYAVATIPMHRLVLNVPKGVDVDHIQGHGLDNRKSRLRPATRKENSYNRTKAHGESKYIGVARDGYGNKWAARIKKAGKAYYLGTWLTEAEAAIARDRAAKYYFKEFAGLNFPNEDYPAADQSVLAKEALDLQKSRRSSRYRYVHKDKKWWKAYTFLNGEHKNCGSWPTEHQAALAADAALRFVGSAEKCNFPDRDTPAKSPDELQLEAYRLRRGLGYRK